jgi:hypothetical protein
MRAGQCHLLIGCPRILGRRGVRLQNRRKRTGLNLPNQRIVGQEPRVRTPDHRVNGHPQSLLGAVSRVIDRLSGRLSDDEHFQIMRRRAGPFEIAGSSGAKNHDALRLRQRREFVGHDLHRPP